MKRLVVAVALVAVAACSEGGDPVQMALRDASAARQAAAVKDGTTSPAQTPRRLAPAAGDPADAAFVAAMIEHHRAAMALAAKAKVSSKDAEIRRLAQAEIDARSRQIAELQAWKAPG